MKRLFGLLLVVGTAAFNACSHQYVMRMSNNAKLITSSRPKLNKETGQYMYKDAHGDAHFVSQARVVEIAPASMAAEESKSKKK